LEKNIEEILEFVWTLNDRNDTPYLERVLKEVPIENTSDYIDIMVKEKLIEIKNDVVSLTAAGDVAGRGVVRRCRLAEWLLSNVFELDQNEWESTACEFEHILSKEVTDSICAFLGHPPTCPHGEPIPEGDCCRRFTKEIKPLVLNLTDLLPGDIGRVVFMTPRHHDRLDRLSSLGLVPGAKIKLHQKQPTYVIDIGETSIAIDYDIAREIFVKKILNS